MLRILFAFIAVSFSFAQSQAASPFTNLESYKTSLGFTKFYNEKNTGRRLRIAVLDKGFHGFEQELGKSLPKNTKYIAGPVAPTEAGNEEHGLKMAQILISMMTDDARASQWTPELSLYNVFGFTNFKSAIDDIIAKKFDLVLYSEVWEYGGNFDGSGFINNEVTRAAKAGIVWVNAAGNFGLTTYNTNIHTVNDNWVQLPDQNNALEIRCEKTSGKCPMKIVLSWNDFKNDVELGTDKDLDLALTDDLLNIVQSSALKQSADPKEDRPGFSKYSREIITAEVSAGVYYLRVKNRSGNFTAKDKLRITLDGDSVTMHSHSKSETVLNPADNKNVITVGASDSDRSSTSIANGKPDLLAPSSIIIANGEEYRGSSNAAAIVAAGLGILKSNDTSLTKDALIKATGVSNNDPIEARGLSLNLLGFAPTGNGCFIDVTYNPAPPYIREVLRRGGVAVKTTASVRILTAFDPILLIGNGARRNMINDMIVALPQGGYAIFNRQTLIPQGAVEIFQRPLEAGLCNPRSNSGKTFTLTKN